MTEPTGAQPPWRKFYGSVPPTLDYPDISLYEGVARVADRAPDAIAWEYFGTRGTYRQLVEDIDRCAALLTSLGLKAGQRMMISMPTTPQGVIAFYAVNRIGAIAVMIHPLSTPVEITHYLDATGARMALVLDAFFGTLAAATPRQPLAAIVVASVADPLPALKRAAFWLTKGHAIAPLPRDARIHRWSKAMQAGTARWSPRRSADDEAVILFSGGTTALPKGIRLSNRAFIAQALQAAVWCGLSEGNSMLAILPLFHGFGLAVCVNAVLMAGGTSILVPQFSASIVAQLLRKRGANVLVGVPTLFDALTREPLLQHTDLSCLKLCFCGADTLPRVVKERFEALVKARGGEVKLLEGYGLTEAVSGIMAMPLDHYREGSIGVPFPDMHAMICAPDSTDEVPVGTEGEICLAGPALMMGYLNDPETTAHALRRHADGRLWLHTGDIGRQDADGFFYFTVRLKRMIKSSGFNVYPAQVEAILREHPAVADACVIGVPDPAQIERVVACVVRRDGAGSAADPALANALIDHCRERILKWSCPREVLFIDALPQTRVGKIDFRALERDYANRHRKGPAA